MSISPLITFKAGRCTLDTSTRPGKVTAQPEKGYIYLYLEDDFIHFCWRARNIPLDTPDLDLMILQDARFEPYLPTSTSVRQPTAATNGRIFNLKFSSSSQRYLFWLQSASQSPTGDAAYVSKRDLATANIVDELLQGIEVDVQARLRGVESQETGGDEDEGDGEGGGDGDGDGDETMEDVEGGGGADDEHRSGGGGGAGVDATGGDFREEGHQSRDAGADGGRA